MKWMVEFHLKPGTKDKVMELFEQRGPNRNPGVKFRGAWIASRADLVYALVESEDETAVENAAQSWSTHGTYQMHPVVDVEQY